MTELQRPEATLRPDTEVRDPGNAGRAGSQPRHVRHVHDTTGATRGGARAADPVDR